MTTQNFNFQEMHDLLLESTVNIDNNRKTKGYGSLWENPLCVNSMEGSSMKENSLSTFVGDITSAAAAVVAADESPMNTPFLDDSCINTPFTPYTVLTPSLAQFQNSSYCSPFIESSVNPSLSITDSHHDDIQVANYLKNDMSWDQSTDLFAPTPAITSTDISPEFLDSIEPFSVDPIQLILNSNAVENTIVPSSVDASSQPLFAPLPSQDNSCSLNSNRQPDESFNSHDFDPNSLFDPTGLLDDDYFKNFLDLTPESPVEQPLPANTPVIAKQLESADVVVSKKRKHEDDKINKKSRRVKVSPTDPVVEKSQDERKFICNICDAHFSRRFNLGTHIKTHIKDRNKEFGCRLCTKSFDRKHDLTRHVATVHNHERAFGCKKCTSAFSRKDALVRHCLQKHNYEFK